MNRSVCIDASLVLDWLLADEQDSRVSNLINIWNKDKYELVSAPLFYAEVTSVLREKVYFRKISPERGEQAFLLSQTIRIRCGGDTKIQMKAWELAKILNLPRAYDMQYLAVAELEDCELWTSDKRLFNSCYGKNKRIRWIGESVD
jgi:predicted nucleic acid-binding protein